MAKDANLEELKDIFSDQRAHLEFALVQKVELAADRSTYRALCRIVPDNYEVISRVGWSSVGDGEGDFSPINPGDLVLIGFGGGEADGGVIISRLSSKQDKIPEMLSEGHSVKRALPGKKLYLGSNIKTLVQKVGGLTDPTENVVLGQVLKQLLIDMLSELSAMAQSISEHTHIGNIGIETTPPLNAVDFVDNKSEFDGQKASPVQDELMLSDIFFTEKGS